MRPGIVIGERYRLERPLGKRARVWRATDRDGRLFALKTAPRPEIDHEFRLLSDLDHPSVVSLIERFDTSAKPVLVLEYLAGGDFVSLAGFGCRHWLTPLAELTGALVFLHAAGLVHRDVKARNVMIDATGHARLIDFGSAAPIGSAWTAGGTTAAVVDPERRPGPVSPRDDYFALARLIEELASGALPAVTPATHRLATALESALWPAANRVDGRRGIQLAVIESTLISVIKER